MCVHVLMFGAYPTASSLWSSAFRAFLTSVELAFLVTGGVYSLNLLFGAPQTAKKLSQVCQTVATISFSCIWLI